MPVLFWVTFGTLPLGWLFMLVRCWEYALLGTHAHVILGIRWCSVTVTHAHVFHFLERQMSLVWWATLQIYTWGTRNTFILKGLIVYGISAFIRFYLHYFIAWYLSTGFHGLLIICACDFRHSLIYMTQKSIPIQNQLTSIR